MTLPIRMLRGEGRGSGSAAKAVLEDFLSPRREPEEVRGKRRFGPSAWVSFLEALALGRFAVWLHSRDRANEKKPDPANGIRLE